MKIIFNIIATIIPLLTIIGSALSLIKQDEEKAIEKYHIKIVKRFAFEVMFCILGTLYAFALPKLELIKTTGNNYHVLLIISIIAIFIYSIFDDQWWVTWINKRNITLFHIKPKMATFIKRLMAISSSVFLIIWIISLNNDAIQYIEKEIFTISDLHIDIRSNANFISSYDKLDQLKEFVPQIKEYIEYNLIYFILLNFLIYLFIRFILIQIIIKLVKKILPTPYCNIRLKDGTTYNDARFINRDSQFFTIRENNKSQAVILNQNEIVEIKIKFSSSIFIR